MHIDEYPKQSTNEMEQDLLPHHGLSLDADYLEAIQLAVTGGIIESQIDQKIISQTSPNAMKSAAAHKRIGRLTQSIQGFERDFNIRYRPEQPNFHALRDEAKQTNQGFV